MLYAVKGERGTRFWQYYKGFAEKSGTPYS